MLCRFGAQRCAENLMRKNTGNMIKLSSFKTQSTRTTNPNRCFFVQKQMCPSRETILVQKKLRRSWASPPPFPLYTTAMLTVNSIPIHILEPLSWVPPPHPPPPQYLYCRLRVNCYCLYGYGWCNLYHLTRFLLGAGGDGEKRRGGRGGGEGGVEGGGGGAC